MTHRSRLTSVLVDVPAEQHARSVEFWSTALGREAKTYDEFPEYAVFGEVTPGIEFMVQSIGDATPHVHFDIETDDVEAEVARLKAAGAAEKGRHKTWVVMQDPAGTVFCVVRVQLKEAFDAHATPWE